MQGEVEFKTLLYVPGMAPFGSDDGGKKNIKMYVKRVFISDEFHGELVRFDATMFEHHVIPSRR